jgi:hypothetical protein
LHENLPKEVDAALRFGTTADNVSPDLQSDTFKETINKLAWAIGSTYAVPYRNPKAGARELAIDLASYLFSLHGYPKRAVKP